MSEPLEHDYIGLQEHAKCERSSCVKESDEKASAANLRETELRLGLPGSESPQRNSKHVFSLFDEDLVENNKGNSSSLSNFVSGGKRVFSDTIYGSEKWVLAMGEGDNLFSCKESDGGGDSKDGKLVLVSSHRKAVVEQRNISSSNDHANAPASKAQVVGWPPIRSFRKNILAANVAKNNDVEGETEKSGCLYVKVSMDGAPFLRKVDLKHYSNYTELSSALEKMFSCFTIGQCSSPNIVGHGGLSKNHLIDLLHGSEYVLTYEDKDSDWMLVGDVPWRMFLDSCKRLRIVRSTDAIGLAPRALHSKNQD